MPDKKINHQFGSKKLPVNSRWWKAGGEGAHKTPVFSHEWKKQSRLGVIRRTQIHPEQKKELYVIKCWETGRKSDYVYTILGYEG